MIRATDRRETAKQPRTIRDGARAARAGGDKALLGGRLALFHTLARLALLWERIWRRIWPSFAVVGLFLIFALFDLPRQMPGWLHLAFLIVFAGALLALVWLGIKRLRMPSARAVRRRLETDSGLKHRPLAALDDELASGIDDPDAVALWQLHRARLLKALSRIGLKLPRPGLAARDPLALRLAVVLLLVTATALAGPEWRERIERALSPSFATAATVPLRLDLWINPPAYTALPPQFLDATEKTSENAPQSPLRVPVGSEVLAQVQGGNIAPELVISAGEQTLAAAPFETLATGSYKASRELTEGTRLAVRQDERELGAWALEVVPDQAPGVEFFSPPARSERAALKLHYEANDDYGLAKVEALVRRLDKPDAEPMTIALPLPGGQPKSAENASYHDLTPHPWAGLAVEITLAAEDAIGQRGVSDPVRTALPERIFNHPVARALVELRKQLTLDPEARYPVVRALSDLYDRPEHFFHDILVALALKTAERRLIYDNSAESVPAVQQLLWDTALHIEDGELAISERDLRDKMQALMDALANNAEDAEIERLMSELQEALDRFLEAMAEQLRERMAEGEEPQPLPPGAEMLRSQDLQDLINRARELAKNGARDAARELLSQLQEMLENLRANPFAGGMDPQTEQAMKMMRDLEGMTKRQQELLDRSYQRWQQQQGQPGQPGQQGQQGQQGQPGQQPGQSGPADALSQEQLRRELGELMRQLGDMMGDIPRPLGRAEQAMRDARDALEQDQSGEAIGPQTRALDQLQQGLQGMAEQMMQQFGQQQGPGGEGQMVTQPGGMTRDPLGRESSDGRLESRDGVEIPSEMEMRRAREILDELRQRRGERNRPEPELEYLDRLLRQF